VFNKRKPEEPKLTAALERISAAAAPGPLPLMSAEDAEADLPAPPNPLTASFKEFPPMARSPFAPPLPSAAAAPQNGAPLRPPAAPASYATPREESAARRTLVVGRGISVQGTVQDAERLVVEGTVEATMINGLTELHISHGGIFKGEVEVDEAEVAGTIDGTLTARANLIVRASGRVLGTARCRRLTVEDGGQITGRIEMLGNDPNPAPLHGHED
jgi:cytoskeletal protein CcmA (bactofilin family)